MIIEVVERFKHKGQVYPVGARIEASDEFANYVMSQGWAVDENGNSAPLDRNKHVQINPK